MGFAVPAFLLGLAALGLPVWLHLLRRHRTTPRPFSSLMFFERRTQSSMRHRRLEHLLLFALRMALLALLAFAFAQPYLKTGAATAGAGSRLLVLAIDNSFSMRAGDRLARAKNEAAATLANGRSAQVLAFASEAHLLTQPTADVAALRGAIQSIEPADARSSYAELMRVLRLVAATQRQPLDIHLFSDLQKTSLPPSFADLSLPAGSRLVPHPVARTTEPNWAVESVSAPRHVYEARKARVTATIVGFSTPAAQRRVSLAVNGRVVESKDATVAANGRTTVEFNSLDTAHGLNRCEVRLEPHDALEADDRRYFAVERAEPRPVLFVHDAGETRGLLYFRAALEASGEAAFRVEDATAAGGDLTRYAFIVLSDPSTPPAEDALEKYVRGGGAVWLALGPNTAAQRRVPLLKARSVRAHYYSREAERFETVSYLDAAHPSIARANKWAGVKFYQATVAELAGMKVAARLADETPLLMEAALGEGRVLVFASTFDNVSNDFPLHASFVPFIQETARYLGGAAGGADFTVDSYVQLHAAQDHGAAVDVTGPDGKRALSLKEAATLPAFPLRREGFYELNRSNGRHEMIAVNADRRESDLALVPADTLALWQRTGQAPATGSGPAAQGAPLSLWWYVLAAALLLALAESLVGNRHLSVAREAPLEKEAAA